MTANATNALSTVVSFAVVNADSARVMYWMDGDTTSATPYYAVREGSVTIVTLGLRPNALYHHVIQAVGSKGTVLSPPFELRSGDLPPSLQGVRLELSGAPSSGYVVTEVTRDTDAFVVAFDESGWVRWYRGFTVRPGEAALDSEQHPGGDFTVFIGASTGWQPVDGRYVEFRADGELVRSYAAGGPYYTDPHELVLTGERGAQHAHLFGYDLRQVDLTAIGGRSDQLVAGHTILRLSPAGAVEFLWDAWDHASLDDWIFVPGNLAQLPSTDFDHPNSLAIDRDGNYVVSFASLGEITKIDAVTGQQLWRFGGRHNQFTILGDPLGGFGFQHDVRVLENGDLTFYDNGLVHVPPQSRAVEYRLDTRALTATLVWEYRHTPAVFTPFVGSVERYRNGNTLIGFGAAALVTEVTPAGAVVWEGRLTVDGLPVPYFYRARWLPSLYQYREP
jgi:outer membrane protein assembly factor BamB